MKRLLALALILLPVACTRHESCRGPGCDYHDDVCDPARGDVCGADAASPDSGSDAGGVVDGGTADAGDAGHDAGNDAGNDLGTDAGNDAGLATIIEEFLDDSALVRAESTASIDPANGGALVAFVYTASDDCRRDYAPDASVTFDGGALLKLNSLHLAPGIRLIAQGGPLEIRVCGDVNIDQLAYLGSEGELRLTAGGRMTVAGSIAAGSLFVTLPDAGTSLTLAGDSASVYAPYNLAGPGGPLRLLVNGDVVLAGHAQLYAEGAPGASVPPLRVAATGSLSVTDSARVYTDDGNGVPGGAPSIEVQTLGNLLLGGFAQLNLAPRGKLVAPRHLALAAGGNLSVAGRGVSISIDHAPSAISLGARGDLTLDGGFLSIYDNESDAGPGSRIDLLSEGAFNCDGNASVSSGDAETAPPYARLPADWGSSVSVSARSVALTSCAISTSGAGPFGQSGAIAITAGDGGVVVAAGSHWYPGINTCSAGQSITVASAGDVSVAASAVFGAGASVGLLDGGCPAAKGGSVYLSASGVAVAGGAQGGPGAPNGGVVARSGAPFDAGVPRVALTLPFVGVSRVYDLGAVARIVAVRAVERPRPPEGRVLLEFSMADTAEGVFSGWTTDLAALGAHRFLRWRATVDGYFLQTAGLDRLEIDYAQ